MQNFVRRLRAGAVIEQKRISRGMAKAELARRCHVDEKTIRNWLREPGKIPLEGLNKMADCLMMTDEEFIQAARGR